MTMSFVWVLFLSILTVISQSYNPVRIFYAIYILYFGTAFLGFGFSLKESSFSLDSFAKFLTILGVFFSFGLAVDAATGGLITLFFRFYGEGDDDYISSRHQFLAEAPQVFGVAYSLCLWGVFFLLYRTKKILSQLLLYICIIIFFFGASFTGTRQILLVLFIFSFINLITYIKKKGLTKILLPSFLVALVGLSFAYQFKNIDASGNLQERYFGSGADKADNERIDYINEGLEEFVYSGDILKVILGNGLGYVSSKATDNEINGSNYENTFFAGISNYGIICFFFLLYPIIYVCKKSLHDKGNRMNVMSVSLLLCHLMICLLSPNGFYPTSMMSIYIIMSIYMAGIYRDYRI